MRLILRHETGELGPKTIDEWNAPNGENCLLVWMLKELEKQGQTYVVLELWNEADSFFDDERPIGGDADYERVVNG